MRFSIAIFLLLFTVHFSYSQPKSFLRPFDEQIIRERKPDDNFVFQPERNNIFFRPPLYFQEISEKYSTYFDQNYKPADMTNLIGIGIGTTALMAFDQYSWKNTRNFYKRSQQAHEIAEIGEFLGNGKFTLYVSGAFAAYGFINNDNKYYRTGIRIFESLIISGLLVQGIKRVAGKESPESHTKDGGRFHLFPPLKEYENHQPHYYAFPSGHISSITSTLTVIANCFPEWKWLKPVSYGLIGLVAFGLVSKNMHWYSDLPLGIFIGHGIANLIAPPEKELPYKLILMNDKLNISPYVGYYHTGFSASLSF
jgi:hypothetical protein